ncbi:hypothetical protein HETIRDRAFT_438870 [Heterobasidion irregulare TC 32-1]|uniref:Uncharacterized protein n=1 Tax=Heterobasidion irregulare (strain TC 32-1) TaxID=747525 RepID=W4KEY1_HETIT|nr:uncharacterized protein HETIRDRAFT_438870 [Heterobasidion irregulare TC 32-1]ETW83865.1 hypothetical protein HETIRDRAFT_438870 [Heterobasidion irregulare TC 32-1]
MTLRLTTLLPQLRICFFFLYVFFSLSLSLSLWISMSISRSATLSSSFLSLSLSHYGFFLSYQHQSHFFFSASQSPLALCPPRHPFCRQSSSTVTPTSHRSPALYARNYRDTFSACAICLYTIPSFQR